MEKRLKKYSNKKKKKTKRCSQENYWRDLQLKSCRGDQIRNTKDKEKKDKKKTKDNRKISQNKKT